MAQGTGRRFLRANLRICERGLVDGAVVAAEGLIRWHDLSGGLVAPGDFLPLAEEMGLIEAIGDWVLEEICRQAAGGAPRASR